MRCDAVRYGVTVPSMPTCVTMIHLGPDDAGRDGVSRFQFIWAIVTEELMTHPT